jgi:predicted alpha/beta superfamily hydrolase
MQVGKYLRFAVFTALAVMASACSTLRGLVEGSTATRVANRVQLDDTEQFTLAASATGRRYPIWVSFPDNYAQQSDRTYPLVLVTDARYSFPLVRSIRNRIGQDGVNLQDFILVGLLPEEGISSAASRARDFTPTMPADAPNDRYLQTTYGEAHLYRDFIETDVFPALAARYRIDMTQKTYIGHSYGGLFGAFVLLTRHELFDNYLLMSPSLWFDGHVIDRMETEYAGGRADLKARVWLAIGAFETSGSSPRNFEETDMVGDNARFAATLRSRAFPSLEVIDEVIADEDHLTVYPAAVTRGLLRMLRGTGPYYPG